MRKMRVLGIADAAFAASGYGNQAEAVLSRLAERGWDVYQLALNCPDLERCEPAKEGEEYPTFHGIKMIRNDLVDTQGPKGWYGSKESILALYNKLKPDVIWSFNDFYRVAGLVELSQEFVDRWVHWQPIDNPYVEDGWAGFMDRMKFLIYCSSFGWYRSIKHVPNVVYKDAIYCAVPSSTFHPLPDKEALKRQHGMGGKFIIVTVGRHQPRKMVWKTANVVAKFLKTHPDAGWVYKGDKDDPAMADHPDCERDLALIFKREGVLERVLFEPKHLTPEEMCEVYNIADIFIHLSGGEGFGIPYVESMMAGTPCILNDNTTSPELIGGRKEPFGKLVKIAGQLHLNNFNADYDLADEDDALAKLNEVYDDWITGGKWLKDASERGIAFHRKWCDSEMVVDCWEDVFNRVIRSNNKVLWHSFFGRGVGFTAISETLIPEMEKLGYDVHVNDWASGSSPILEDKFRKLYEKYLAQRDKIDWKKYPQVVCWLMDSFETVAGEHKLGWSFAESTKIRSYYQHFCNSMEYILTSSEFNKKVQKDSGFTSDIRIVPPCVDPLKFPRLERKDEAPFTFLHIGVVQERKNPGMVLAGYVQAFPVDDGQTKLIMKSNDFGTFDELKTMYKERSDIEFIYTDMKPLDQKELLALYQRSDVYVNLSHGEGIGMPDIEAMATGLPVIGTNWDTRGVFLDDTVGWMVKVVGMGPAYTLTVKDDCGNWAYLDGQDYIRILKEVAKAPEEARKRGKAASERVQTMFTPEKAAKALDGVLMEIYGKRTGECKSTFEDERYYIDTNQYTPLYFEGAAQIIMAQCPEMRKGDSVLDIGCGRGFLTLHLLRNGVNVKGIDISEYAVTHPLPGCEGALCRGDAMDLPYEDKSFDWAVSFSVLEHLPEKQVPKAIREMARVVRKGAFLRIAIPYPHKEAAELFKEDNTHITLKPKEWWIDTLAANGMKLIATDGQYDMLVVPIIIASSPIVPGDRVLIGVPTKNRLPYLKKLIASLQTQTFKDWDLMIVDDSDDESMRNDPELLMMFDRLYLDRHVWHLIKGAGQSQVAAHNRVLDWALENNYRLVMRLDDDITLEPDHLGIIFKEFLKDQKCEYAAMGGIYLDPSRTKEQQMVPPNWKSMPEFAGKLDPLWPFAQMALYPEDMEFRDDVQHLYSSYFYRPELLKEVGGFAKDLSAVGFREETLPIFTLWLKGYKLKVCLKALGFHYNAQTGGLRSYNQEAAAPMYRSDDALFKARLASLRKKYGR